MMVPASDLMVSRRSSGIVQLNYFTVFRVKAIHSFIVCSFMLLIYPFIRCLLSACYLPGTLLNVEDSVI